MRPFIERFGRGRINLDLRPIVRSRWRRRFNLVFDTLSKRPACIVAHGFRRVENTAEKEKPFDESEKTN